MTAPIEVNAAGSAVTEYLIRFVMRQALQLNRKPTAARLHPEQIAMVENLFSIVAMSSMQIKTIEDLAEVDRLLTGFRPKTLMGVPIVEDPRFARDRIQFEDPRGAIITLYGLCVPAAYHP